ncbi:MAG: UDP-diphospho-muramoylpentapeptide beta-N-acetylglucosaminyltransferase, partial [Pseudoflavonifractor sp.]
GYTDHVADYMANADLMLSKPGGITLFETIAAKETEDCLDAVERLIHNDGALAWMAGNMRRLKAEQEPAPLAAILNKLSAGKRVCA